MVAEERARTAAIKTAWEVARRYEPAAPVAPWPRVAPCALAPAVPKPAGAAGVVVPCDFCRRAPPQMPPTATSTAKLVLPFSPWVSITSTEVLK